MQQSWLQDLTAYWADGFDWRAQERQINQLAQFMVEIDGIPIHFVHVKGKGPSPKPIILSHGWPWTFWDWRKVIGPLTDPVAHGGKAEDAFDVIVPSLPGFGFSVPLQSTQVGARRIADLWHVLMTDVLGYRRYAAGGGDWGSTITGELGHGYPEQVIGVWLTLPNVPGVALWQISEKDFAPEEKWMWERALVARPVIMSHSTVHRNEPQTIAYALVDSPVGMAAWILGRRRDWGDHDGNIFKLFDRDFLCTTASIYWLNRSIATSMRIYHDHYVGGTPPAPRHNRPKAIEVPTAFSVFPKELLLMPRAIAERATNLHRWTIQPKGGHYPPSEQPDLVVTDLREFFRPLQ
ncbi:MAG: epoxide hydrolase [Betaproteobacteria bacterium]|nr:epoxide hydrolase [Betaproteobacteria bacterium]